MKKKVWALLVAAMLAAAPALAESVPEAVEVAGYVLEGDAFRAMEEGFRQAAFSGEMYSVELTDTQTLMFVTGEAEHMVPSLTVLISEPVVLVDDLDEAVAIVQSLLETMQWQQTLHPEVMAFDNERAQAHAETGLGFAVEDRAIWLWAEDGSGLVIPMYLHDGTTGEMVDGVYLLSICPVEEDSGYYALYNDPALVLSYLGHVEIRSDVSGFQQAISKWYVQTFMADGAAAGDGQRVRIVTDGGNARAEDHEEAQIVGRVVRGEEYALLSVTERGWYEIELEDGARAFISSKIGQVVTP